MGWEYTELFDRMVTWATIDWVFLNDRERRAVTVILARLQKESEKEKEENDAG